MPKKLSKNHQKYLQGLEYLKKTGFDLTIVDDSSPILPTTYKYKEHSYFDNDKRDIKAPYIFNNHLLTKEFLEHYDIKTDVDIARYLRIISIILTGFVGPEDVDDFKLHKERLRRFFSKEPSLKRTSIKDALQAYDEYFLKMKKISDENYINFGEILNDIYQIYESIDFFPGDSSIHLDSSSWEDEYLSWLKTPEDLKYFQNIDDNKLIEILSDIKQRAIFLEKLNSHDIGFYEDRELKELVSEKGEREKLLNKIQDWIKNQSI
ncbi:MAG: hypothetical protein ACTSUX_08820 [Promethearchaeota archaeon]